MRKNLGNLFYFTTALLCLVFVLSIFQSNSIETHAAESKATLLDGTNFNEALRKLTKSKVLYVDYSYQDETKTKKIDFLSSDEKVDVSGFPSTSVGNNVNAYYDAKTGTIYITSPADKICLNPRAVHQFRNFAALEVIDFGDKIDTSTTWDMACMFASCKKLKRIDLTHFDTSSATRCSDMFSGCSSLVSLDLSNFDTSKVQYFDSMFHDCRSLKKIDVSRFNTANATIMMYMFSYCTSLTTLDLRNFKTSKVENFKGMFQNCEQLKSVNVSSFDTSNVGARISGSMLAMFRNCYALENLNLSNFDTSHVTDMAEMFLNCKNLKHINLSSFKTPNVTSVDKIFSGCARIEELDLSTFDLTRPNQFNGPNVIGVFNKSVRYICSPTNMKAGINCYDTLSPDNTNLYALARDDNGDGQPDSSERFGHTIPATKESHRYIIVDVAKESTAPSDTNNNSSANTPEYNHVVEEFTLPMSVTIDNVSYYIDKNGEASVIGIFANKKVKIDTITVNNVIYPVTSIGNYAAKGNKELTSVTIGKNVRKIGKKAFYDCKKLKKVTLKVGKSISFGRRCFCNMGKGATITVTGVKGKSRKNVIVALRRHTTAKIK